MRGFRRLGVQGRFGVEKGRGMFCKLLPWLRLSVCLVRLVGGVPKDCDVALG